MDKLLFTKEIKETIFHELRVAKHDVLIVSAYCKSNVIEEFDDNIKSDGIQKALVVRFKYEDIISGATDFDLYDTCIKLGWKFYVKIDLHAKTYLFDKCRCIIGSANATNSGLSKNSELATLQILDEEDYIKMHNILDESILMDNKLYEMMRQCLLKRNIGKNISQFDWDQDILEKFSPKILVMFSNDFPQFLLPEEHKYYDFIDDELVSNNYNSQFKKSKCYRWLKQVLLEKENKEIYFGEITAKLHNVLISDPPPYRKDVKEYLANLLSWVSILCSDEIIIDRPNYSQRIKLLA